MPTPAVAGEDALGVQMLDDGLDAHLAAVALAFESEPIDQTDRVSMQRVDFQPLLGLGPTLFGGGDPVADRRQSTIPEALPGRSEEHTSELQSLMRISYAVSCLKKKTSNIDILKHSI